MAAVGRRDSSAKKTQNILSRYDRSLAFLFAIERIHRSRLSYFFACIDFAPASAEINAEQLALPIAGNPNGTEVE